MPRISTNPKKGTYLVLHGRSEIILNSLNLLVLWLQEALTDVITR